ncbi:MAG TPA: hypothetical protein DEG17_02705 [Cyanobacteria bacterium UBA11149]|nr:hypothetical protein [Cyanobacteria bacterium UBA11366]HBK64656.1 hypothetical protein [Cyanobacteria bacterium UBA11166]HBR76220.1 hypothetical protein [Cyanobacteria bacterium UBA11159]HBS69971.1 hypothetical protein [Cyanobacteria bacterium UBA11153]HBW87815.1 hypothetical protein [Cyanobacteria bacterium UBA11149]HCA94238.1 hypothetical protein [Cyanobacteria bacterium UBA9226]
MPLEPKIMKAVEELGYRVTVGDVATRAGLNINLAEQGLLALASEASGHLQVAESGDIAYLFPKNFRTILRNKFFRIQLQEWWSKIWRVLFYLIRISFGIILILSIALIAIAIIIITIASSDSGGGGGGGGGGSSSSGSSSSSGGGFWNFFWLFDFDSHYSRETKRSSSKKRYSSRYSENNEEKSPDIPRKREMNFLESIFSFLFGDGNPNAELEKCRWQAIGRVIRNSGGAVVAEQIAPYLDNIGNGYQRESEDYMLQVLTKFNGRPEVSPDGDIIYHFPELQTTAQEDELVLNLHNFPVQIVEAEEEKNISLFLKNQFNKVPEFVTPYLQEKPWRFSAASSGQIILGIGLGGVNLIGALMLGSMLKGGIATQLGGFVAFVASIYGILLAYGIGFLTIPIIRYFWIQWKNSEIEERNQQRKQNAIALRRGDTNLQAKLTYAQQFAARNVIRPDNLTYTSETDLLDQEIDKKAQIDAEWQRRLDSK